MIAGAFAAAGVISERHQDHPGDLRYLQVVAYEVADLARAIVGLRSAELLAAIFAGYPGDNTT
jgi:hypothetical protein